MLKRLAIADDVAIRSALTVSLLNLAHHRNTLQGLGRYLIGIKKRRINLSFYTRQQLNALLKA